MDRRKIRSKTGVPRLGLNSDNIGENSNSSQLSVRSNSGTSFRPVFPSSKRKKSPEPKNLNEVERELSNITSKKRRSEDENPISGTQERGDINRPSSRMSNFGSQASTKSRSSVMSILVSRSNKNSDKPTPSVSNLMKNPESQRSQRIPEQRDQTQKSPPKNQSQRSSLSTNTEEFERVINENDTESSPQKLMDPRLSSPRKRLLEQLTTPSKDGESESDKSLFSSGSSSAKKRGRFSLPGTPEKKKVSPRSNATRRILENQNTSPIRNREKNTESVSSVFTPIRPGRNEEEFPTPRPVRMKNAFISFLKAAGVTLMEGKNPHEINDDPKSIKEKMRKLLQSDGRKYKKAEIIEEWKNYIENDQQLRKAINNLKVTHDGLPFPSWFNTSLIKLLLGVTEIQPELLESLLQKLNEVILEATEPDSVSWTSLLVQQLRFLETIVDPELMTISIENMIETTPIWFQREFIFFLPDIVVDSQHHAIAEMLVKLLELRPELTNVILDSISTLTIGEQYFEELRINVTNMLETTEPCTIPAIAKFVLTNCSEEIPAKKILQMLRTVHLEPLPTMNVEECFTNQILTLKVLKSSMLTSKKVALATLNVIKVPDEEAKPMDLILLLLLFSTGPTAKKNTEVILKQHLRSGYYRLSLLKTFYKDWLEVARELQSAAWVLAGNLLKCDDRLYVEFGIEWFISMILSQERIYKQREVLETILQLVGYNNLTARNAFKVLSKMIMDDKKREYLQSHCNMLKILLEKIDNLDLESVAILSDVLHGLCIQSSSTSESLEEDLYILMQKQLASPKPLTKCKGVLGAVMSIKHSASKPETCKKAREIFEKLKIGVKHCPRSRALFYDRLSQVVADTKTMDQEFLQDMVTYFESVLGEYLEDKTPASDDMEAKFGLNSSNDEPSNIIVNFGEGKFGGIVPALFRLLRMCSMRLSGDDNLQEINALLGCGIVLPKDLVEPDPRNLDYMLYCINWFREVISGFVRQSDSMMQRQVLKRLDHLMQMQGEFQMMLSMCDTRYQPPQAYFHHFPAKPFIKVDKKSSKKGKKGAADKSHSVSIPEWETFDLGSLLASKNPAYFRQLDTKVAHLLDIKMDMTLTQTSSQAVSIAQVCFLVKELLGMLENNDSESLIYDLISLLPQVCSKLQDIVEELRDNEIDDSQKREAVVLLLKLINQIFSWKELFNSAKYNILLRDGLRTIAMQVRTSNSSQISIRDLVSESYKYFEMMRDIAESRSMSLAHGIVSVCGTLMKHSKTFSNDNKGKHATMAYDFLRSQDWLDKQIGPAYRGAVAGLLKTWIDYEPSPLDKIKEVIEWLPDEVQLLDKPSDCLTNLPSINKSIFPLLFKKVFEGLIKGTRNDLQDSKSDPERIKIWKDVGLIVKELVKINKILKSRTVYLLSVKYLIILMRIFLNLGYPIMEQNLRYQTNDVFDIIKLFQGGTRFLHNIYCMGVDKKDTTYAKYFPAIKSVYEEHVRRMKAMMALNNTLDCFEIGNLIKKDVEGNRILSQSSTDETASLLDGASTSDGSRVSEILGVDEESLLEESADENLDEENPEEDPEEDSDVNIDSI